MRVLLISANTERIKMTALPLGLGLVAAATRQAGHETAYLDLLGHADPCAAAREAVASFGPEVIGISVRNIDDQSMETQKFLLGPVKDLVAACRAASEAPIVLGGAAYSMFPDAALEFLGADLGVCGEGEAAFPALLACLEQGGDPGDVPGVHVRGTGRRTERAFVPDLDALPLAHEDLWSSADPNDPELWVPVQTRRGCPMDCSYCSTADIEGRSVRFRSPRRVAGHLAEIARAGFKRFYFVDNTFNLPADYALELRREIKALSLGLSWRCILYPQNVSEELVAAMAEAGCYEASLGFESGSPAVLKAMNKRFEPEEVRAISDRLKAHGIRRFGFLLLGGPGETRETVEESLAFADSLGLDMLSLTAGIRIYPRTRLARIAVEEGMIAPDDNLLLPRFYVRPELEPWLREIAASRAA